jgi:hypothetical protein
MTGFLCSPQLWHFYLQRGIQQQSPSASRQEHRSTTGPTTGHSTMVQLGARQSLEASSGVRNPRSYLFS